MLIWGGGPVAISITVMGLLLVWRHTANIQKLLNGTESKLGQKAQVAAAAVASQAHGHAHAHGKPHHRHDHKHGAKS